MRAQQAFRTGLCSRVKKWLTCSQALEWVRPMKPQPMTAMLRGLDMMMDLSENVQINASQ